MKDRLTIKDVAPYLPYGLKWINRSSYRDYADYQVEMTTLQNDGGKLDIMFETELGNTEWLSDKLEHVTYTPLLHPLSRLTESITVKGKDFIPMERMLECDEYCDAWYEWTSHIYDFQDKIHEASIMSCPIGFAEKLYSWHLDVHGLIEQGLAEAITL